MIDNNRLLIIGGTGRNTGKTEFVCRIIQKFSANHDIFGLKVSSIFPDEELYHGNHSVNEPQYGLFEETRCETTKDTSRMLRAGAKRVFYLRGDDQVIKDSYEFFCDKLPTRAIIVCESNSLAQVVQPGLFLMVRSSNGTIKPRAVEQLEKADLIIVSDGSSGFPELDGIQLTLDNGWQLV